MSSNDDGRPSAPKTIRGFAVPNDARIASFDDSAEATIPDGVLATPIASQVVVSNSTETAGDVVPLVSVELVEERGIAPMLERPWHAFQVWTRNNVYSLDHTHACVEVFDRVKQQPDADHPLIGARLVGGQRIERGVTELSHPFPRPGAEAVFERRLGNEASFNHTSPVERVVMRVRVVSVGPAHAIPGWNRVTGSFEFKLPDGSK